MFVVVAVASTLVGVAPSRPRRPAKGWEGGKMAGAGGVGERHGDFKNGQLHRMPNIVEGR